jgi:hypothetical protein
MSTQRTLHLVVYPKQVSQHAHFGIRVADKEGGDFGTLIHVVGSPMTGSALQFRRRYAPKDDDRHPRVLRVGEIETQHIHDYEGERGEDITSKGSLEGVAAQIQPPRPSENFRAPINDVSVFFFRMFAFILTGQTTNRRCQEWTMDFVRRLVAVVYLDESLIKVVQSQ